MFANKKNLPKSFVEVVNLLRITSSLELVGGSIMLLLKRDLQMYQYSIGLLLTGILFFGLSVWAGKTGSKAPLWVALVFTTLFTCVAFYFRVIGAKIMCCYTIFRLIKALQENMSAADNSPLRADLLDQDF